METEDYPGFRPEPRVAGNMFGREDAIKNLKCIGEPIGTCDRQLTREQVSKWPNEVQKEYVQSGWCNICQDKVFGFNQDCTCDNPCCEVDIGVGIMTCTSQHCRVHGEIYQSINSF